MYVIIAETHGSTQEQKKTKNMPYLPPANEVCEGYVFTPVCQSFCSQGGVPWQVHPPGQVHPPTGRYRPGRYTPLGRYTPRQVHVLAGTPPGQIHPPLEQCMLGDTGNKQAVCTLLECILVLTKLGLYKQKVPIISLHIRSM